MIDLPLFPTWSPIWKRGSTEFSSEKSKLELKVRTFNNAFPVCKSVDLRLYIGKLKSFDELSAELLRDRTFPSRHHRRRFIKALKDVTPLIVQGLWTRWLDLEAGAGAAARAESLLPLAILARSFGEETLRCGDICQKLNMLFDPKAGSFSDSEFVDLTERLRAWALPRLRQRSVDDLKSHRMRWAVSEHSEQLEEARRDLNDYVHPNYGSHTMIDDVASPFGAIVVMRSLCAVYEFISDQPWMTDLARHRKIRRKAGQLDSESMDGTGVREIASVEYEGLGNHYVKAGAEWLLNAKSVSSWDILTSLGRSEDISTTAFESLLRAVGSTWNAFMETGEVSLVPKPYRNPDTLLLWSAAVRAKTDLEDEIEVKSVTERLEAGISKFYSLVLVKEYLLRDVLYDVVNFQLPVSSAALARALLEQHGVSEWLSTRADGHVDKLTASGRESEANTLESVLSKALVGTKSSREEASSLKEFWSQLYGEQSVNLMTTIKSLPDPLQFEYDLLSQVAHGFTLVGADLIGIGGKRVIHQSLARDLSILGHLSSYETQMSALPSRAMLQIQSLNSELLKNMDFVSAAKNVALPQKLKKGRDYFGAGTEDDPIYFRDGLNYHMAFYKFCEQNAYDPDRIAWLHNEYFGDQLSTKDGHNLYFAAHRNFGAL